MWLVCADVPQGRPTVRVKETSPNMVILEVDPPRNNGGKEVTGYRVEFGRKMTDYAVGLFTLLYNIIIIIIITIIVIVIVTAWHSLATLHVKIW